MCVEVHIICKYIYLNVYKMCVPCILKFSDQLGAHMIYIGITGMYVKRVHLGAKYLSRSVSKKGAV